MSAALTGLLLFASSVWIGSLVCLIVVAGAARSSLDPAARVAFFRALGRRYGVVGTSALVVAIAAGLALGWPPSTWNGLDTAAAALTAAVVVATVMGIRQARAMTRIRQRTLAAPSDQALAVRLRWGAKQAVILRGLIAVFTLAVIAVTSYRIGG